MAKKAQKKSECTKEIFEENTKENYQVTKKDFEEVTNEKIKEIKNLVSLFNKLKSKIILNLALLGFFSPKFASFYYYHAC